MARRRDVQIFGLSMLDTITCGLGGGIILMLFIASQIPPEAEVVFDNAQQVGDSTPVDSMDDTQVTTGVLTVFLEFLTARDPKGHKPIACGPPPSQAAARHLRIARLGDPAPDKLFADNVMRRRIGYTVWWRGAQGEIPNSYNCFKVKTGRDCHFSYVAGAHYTTWRECPPDWLLFRRVNPEFFKLSQ